MARRAIWAMVAATIATLCSSDVSAKSDCAGPSDECVAVGGWSLSAALGAGVRTNPLLHGQDIPLLVVPQFSYYGKRFFVDNLDAGFSVLEGDSSTLSLVASPGYDRVFFYRSDLQNLFIDPSSVGAGGSAFTVPHGAQLSRSFEALPPRARKVTYLAGPEWTFKHAGISGQLDYLHEITGHHHGDEIRTAVGVPLGTALGGSWSFNLGATWKSEAVVNYYYGYPGLYHPGWALDPFAKIGYSRVLSSKWTFNAFVHHERLGQAIADSPIVAQRYVTTAFVGVTYLFHK